MAQSPLTSEMDESRLPQNEFEGACDILKEYHRTLVQQMAEEIVLNAKVQRPRPQNQAVGSRNQLVKELKYLRRRRRRSPSCRERMPRSRGSRGNARPLGNKLCTGPAKNLADKFSANGRARDRRQHR